MKVKKIFNKLSINLILILSGVLSVLLFLIIKPTSVPTDMLFHVSRLQGLDNFFSSPVNFNNFNGSGKIVNIMYPPITLLPVLLTKIFSQDLYVRYIFAWIYVGVIQSYVGYYSAKKMINNTLISLLFAILCTFSVSKFNYMFEHAAISNVLALGFIPLVLLGFKELIFKNYKKIYTLAIGLSLIALSHILTALLVNIFLIFAYVVSLVYVKINWQKFKYQILFGVLFICLSLLIILPMIEQFSARKLISANIIWNIHGTSLWRYISLSFQNENYLGLFNLIAFVVCCIFSFKFSRFEKTIFIATLLMGVLALDITPWQLLKHTFLVQLQYPTPRITSVMNVIINFLFVKILVTQLLTKSRVWNYIGISLMVVVYISLSWQLGLKSYERAKNGAVVNSRKIETLFTSPQLSLSSDPKRNFYINGDYTNVGYKSHDTKLKNYYTINNQIIKNNVNVSASEVVLNLNAKQVSDNKLVTPISLYKGINVLVNNKPVNVKLSKYQTVEIPLQKSQINKVKITYKWTLFSRLSQIVSVLSWLGLGLYIWKSNHKSD